MKNQDGTVLGEALLQAVLSLQRVVRVLTRTPEPPKELVVAVDDAADDLAGLLLLVPNFVEQSARLSRVGRSINAIRAMLAKLAAMSDTDLAALASGGA